MNEFRNRSNGEIRSEQQIRESMNALLPAVFDSSVCDVLDIDPILKAPQPSSTKYQRIVRDGVEQDGLGNWIEKWAVIDFEQSVLDSLLEKLKLEKNQFINDMRLAASYSSFVFASKEISCDELSRSDIESTNSQIIKHGALPTGWPGGWKAQDNTYVPITSVNEWNQFYDAMYETGMANFLKSQNLKLQLSTATLENIDSIVW